MEQTTHINTRRVSMEHYPVESHKMTPEEIKRLEEKLGVSFQELNAQMGIVTDNSINYVQTLTSDETDRQTAFRVGKCDFRSLWEGRCEDYKAAIICD